MEYGWYRTVRFCKISLSVQVSYVLRVQEVLTCLLDEKTVAQLLLADSPKLSKEQIMQLLKFQELATPTR